MATILGVFGQSFAYFFSDQIIGSSPVFNLTAITILSVILYLNSFVATILQYKKRKIEKNTMEVYLSIFVVFGLFTSGWSVFVLAMWWG
ncbi:hypothetical protein MUN88_13725 [Gracilibacillus caseinilyticus]|uniref:Uncharacterized protein n=1 Tax=Gracilibacillus caseinilyticus TaxID=2932256 RepID=A0ABY4ETC2_9BACI|nr:hypothetical protein [Gracilibacillus caseinilyticus]UOQ47133.1 hypothetical protein MUN88_13725 [Gracilibacillus caseinilyticus]